MRAFGNAVARPIVDQPRPQPTSSTAPPASSAAARSGSVSTQTRIPCAEAGAVQGTESVPELGAVLVEGDSAALPEVGDELGERKRDTREHAGGRARVRRMGLIEEHGHVVLGEEEAPRLMLERRGLLDHDDAGGGLLLEPFAGIARGDVGGCGECCRRDRTLLVQRAIEAELPAELDRQQPRWQRRACRRAARRTRRLGWRPLAPRGEDGGSWW